MLRVSTPTVQFIALSSMKTYIIDGDSLRPPVVHVGNAVTEDLHVHEELAMSNRQPTL